MDRGREIRERKLSFAHFCTEHHMLRSNLGHIYTFGELYLGWFCFLCDNIKVLRLLLQLISVWRSFLHHVLSLFGHFFNCASERIIPTLAPHRKFGICFQFSLIGNSNYKVICVCKETKLQRKPRNLSQSENKPWGKFSQHREGHFCSENSSVVSKFPRTGCSPSFSSFSMKSLWGAKPSTSIQVSRVFQSTNWNRYEIDLREHSSRLRTRDVSRA